MNNFCWNDLCTNVCTLASQTGEFLRSERENISSLDAESKGLHDYVTRFDRESERHIVEQLRAWLPSAGFIAEEGSASFLNESLVWIIDPLDGTTNFIHRFAPTCVSIALYEHHEGSFSPILGVVYEIWAKECFYACCDVEGAFLNGTPIHVSQTPTLNDALLATGFPYTRFQRLPQYMNLLSWTMEHTHGVRRLGSAAADLTYVACGRADGFYEYGLKPYDVAAGAFIVDKAGGNNSDFNGLSNWLFGQEIISANPFLFDELTTAVQRFLLDG